MKKENEALWREVVSLRQKHQSQQKIVNKLIQFLVSMVQPRMNNSVKRRYPPQLAIQDGYVHGGKEQKLSASVAQAAGGGASSVHGPLIRDITHADIVDIASLQTNQDAETPTIEMPGTPENNSHHASGGQQKQQRQQQQQQLAQQQQQQQQRPVTPVAPAMQPVDPSLVNPSLIQTALGSPPGGGSGGASPSGMNLLAVPPTRPTLHREISREDFDLEMNIMQKDLDNLKDILSTQITLDSNLISNLFSPEEPLSSILPASSGSSMVSSVNDHKLPLEMANNSASSGTPGKSATGAASLGSGAEFQNPSLFELDIDDDVNEMPTTTVSKLAMPSATGAADLDSLNTPLVMVDQTNPLLASIKK